MGNNLAGKGRDVAVARRDWTGRRQTRRRSLGLAVNFSDDRTRFKILGLVHVCGRLVGSATGQKTDEAQQKGPGAAESREGCFHIKPRYYYL
ncbi:MAG: hypothetical protein LBN33_01855 [Desulfovibrio sp.]|jgi:hypothetical protein|nr:hypothetical protein [Desulfovibrio sp.]